MSCAEKVNLPKAIKNVQLFPNDHLYLELKTARIEHDREQRKMEKRYNEEVDEMENLLFDLQKKMSNGDKSLSGGQFWTFLRREDHDKLGKVNWVQLNATHYKRPFCSNPLQKHAYWAFNC